MLLREFRQSGTGQAALVTPDRRLARRVAQALRRWNIEVDDSAGEPLTQTPAGVLLRLVCETALSGFDPIVLLSLLKHPLARFSRTAGFVRNTARALEIGVLRGPLPAPGPDGLRAAIESIRRQERENRNSADQNNSGKKHFAPYHRRYVGEAEWQDILELLDLIDAAFKPLTEFHDRRKSGTRRAGFHGAAND